MGSEKTKAGKTGQTNKAGKAGPFPRLSKSKVMLGRQCHRALCLEDQTTDHLDRKLPHNVIPYERTYYLISEFY